MSASLDLDALEETARAAGGEVWTAESCAAGENGRRDVIWSADGDGVAIAYHCIGHIPEALSAEDIAAHIAAANPSVVQSLIERVRSAEASHEAARALLVEVLAADDEAIADAGTAGLAFPSELTALTERIRAFVVGGAA